MQISIIISSVFCKRLLINMVETELKQVEHFLSIQISLRIYNTSVVI